jgi:phosphatidylinositol alpha-1,6-mannosyltransferase
MTTPTREKAGPIQGPREVAPRHPCALFAVDSLTAGNGGIGRVSRLMARVLGELHASGELRVHGLAYGDREPAADLGLPVQAARRSKARLSLSALRSALDCTHCIYDAASVGQLRGLPLLRRKPSLMYIHGIEVWEKAAAKYIHTARQMTLLLANSCFTRDKAERLHGGFARARVCWLATEADTPPPAAPPCGERPPRVLIVGRAHAERPKGHRELIAGWPRVVAAVPQATLDIVGTGPDLPSLQELAARSPAARQIVFHRHVPDAALEGHYASARVFAMPSRGEGFGLVYIEAMRHGLPVIGSVHDAAAEVIRAGRTGYVVNLDDPDELAARLIQLLQEPRQAQQLGQAGQQRWTEHFRYTAFRERFLAVLDDFMGLRPRQRTSRSQVFPVPRSAP